MKNWLNIPGILLRLSIRLYQVALSPLLLKNCRYLPTCSEYAIEAITAHGAIRGMYYSLRRICRCHPWGGHGLDPIPSKIKVK